MTALSRFSIRTRLLLGVLLFVVGYAASTTLAFVNGRKSEAELRAAGAVNAPIALKAQALHFAFDTSTKEFSDAIMTGEATLLETADASNLRADALISEILASNTDGSIAEADVLAIRSSLAAIKPLRLSVFEAISSNGADAPETKEERTKLSDLTDRTKASIESFAKTAAEKLQDRLDLTTESSKTLRHNNLIFSIVVIVVATSVVLFTIQRGVVKPVVTVVNELKTTSSGVDTAAELIRQSGITLAEGSSEQAASIEETSATLETIASMAQRNAKDSLAAQQRVGQVKSAAERGSVEMESMRQAISAMKEASDNIARIVKTIDEIAFQTNLLALNAAVEAARAGSAGAGFAVVAEEVRNLAQRSATAAKETAAIIADSIAKSDKGVAITAQVAASLTSIAEEIRQVDKLMGEIAVASQEQSTSVDEVNRAVGQLDKITQRNAAAAQESAATDAELATLAKNLHSYVTELFETVYGHKTHRGQKGDAAASATKSESRELTTV